MTISRREVLLGVAGLVGSSLRVLAIICSGDGSPYHASAHSIFGEHFDDAKGDPPPTHKALRRALGFLDHRISDAPHLPDYPDQQPCPPQFHCFPESQKTGE